MSYRFRLDGCKIKRAGTAEEQGPRPCRQAVSFSSSMSCVHVHLSMPMASRFHPFGTWVYVTALDSVAITAMVPVAEVGCGLAARSRCRCLLCICFFSLASASQFIVSTGQSSRQPQNFAKSAGAEDAVGQLHSVRIAALFACAVTLALALALADSLSLSLSLSRTLWACGWLCQGPAARLDMLRNVL